MGLLVSVVGAGSLAGSLTIAAIGRKKRGAMLLLTAMLSGIGLLMIGVFPYYFAAVALMIPVGLGEAGRWSLNQALVMENTDDRFRGRVMSIFSLTWGLIPLGALPFAVLIDLLGGRMAIGILAGLLMTFVLTVTVTRKDLLALQ
jgi:MFS family permease